MPGHTAVEGRQVELRTITREDLPVIWRLYGDPEVRRFLGAGVKPVYPEDEEEWYARIRSSRDTVAYAVTVRGSDRVVGVVDIHWIDAAARHGAIGYWIGRQYWGRGYATEAVSLMLRYGFEWLGLNKVWARVYEYNKASIRVLEKNGFRLAGRLRRHVYAPGRGLVDLLIYEVLREEWEGQP